MRISDWSSDVCSSDLRLTEQIDLEIADAQPGLRDYRGAAPAQHVDTRQQFGHGEGLGQIIVAAGAQARDAFIDLAERAQDQHRRRVASRAHRSEEHTSELQSLMRISYAVFCLKKKIHTY